MKGRARQVQRATGLEGAPDIMLLTMSALVVMVIWLVAHAQERTLPAIDLARSESATLGADLAAAAIVTLRQSDAGRLEVFVDDRRIAGLDALESALDQAGATSVTLRAEPETGWQDVLTAMTAAAALDLPLSVAANTDSR